MDGSFDGRWSNARQAASSMGTAVRLFQIHIHGLRDVPCKRREASQAAETTHQAEQILHTVLGIDLQFDSEG